jgi:outer membrane protein TolC
VSIGVSVSLSLPAVVEAAFRRNPTVEAVRSRRGVAEALRTQASSLIAGDASLHFLHHDDRVLSRRGYQEWDSGIEFPIWLPGQRDARMQVAERSAQAAAAAERQLRLAVAGMVREDLWRIALLENAAANALAERDATRKLEQDVRRRVELGDLARIDLVLAQQETLDKEAVLVRAREEHWHAIHRYELFTGLDSLPQEYRERQSALMAVSPEHPALLEAGADTDAARARRELAKKESRASPTVLLGSKHEINASGEDSVDSLAMELFLPLGLPAHAAPRIANSEREVAESSGEYEKRWRDIKLAIDSASHEVHTLAQESALAAEQAVLATEHLRMARLAFELGESDLVSFLRVQKSAFAAARRLQQKRIEQELSIARYNQAVGIIP